MHLNPEVIADAARWLKGKPKWMRDTYWAPIFGYGSAALQQIALGKVPAMSGVYVIEAGEQIIKVGVSNNAAARARDIQTGQHHEVRVFWAVILERLDAYRVEKEVHKLLRQAGVGSRGEWFYADSRDAITLINKTIQKFDLLPWADPRYGVLRGDMA